MLNRKVLVKLDMKLSSDTIHQLANGSQGAIEKLLTKLRMKVLKDGVEMHKSKLKGNDNRELHLLNGVLTNEFSRKFNVLAIGEKIEENSPDNDGYLKSSVESTNKSDTDNETREIKPSKFTCLKRGFLTIFNQIICFFRIWNIFNYRILPRFRRKIFDT